jgi:hypothetical protein
MVELLTWAIKKPMENSELVECGHPKGAVALAAAGVCNNVDACPLLADQCTRSSEPFKCFIQARKSAVAHFPVNLMEMSWRTTWRT